MRVKGEVSETTRLIFRVLFFLVISAITFFVARPFMRGLFSQLSDSVVTAQMKKDIEAENKKCPREIGPGVRAEKVSLLDSHTVEYRLTLLELDAAGAPQSYKNAIKGEALKSTQAFLDTGKVMQPFREHDIALRYCYMDKHRNELFSFTIRPNKEKP